MEGIPWFRSGISRAPSEALQPKKTPSCIIGVPAAWKGHLDLEVKLSCSKWAPAAEKESIVHTRGPEAWNDS